jgi:hypothetical protein
MHLSKEYGTSRPIRALWFFEKLFWAVIYTVGGVATAIYCWILIQQYSAGETQYNVALLVNKSISLPDGRLCLDHENAPVYYAQNPSDVGVKMVLTNALEHYFNSTTAIATREAFLDPKQNWNESLTFAASMYVSMLMNYEIGQNINILDVSQFEYRVVEDSTYVDCKLVALIDFGMDLSYG